MILEAAKKRGFHWIPESLLFVAVAVGMTLVEAVPQLFWTVAGLLVGGERTLSSDFTMLISLFGTGLGMIAVLLFCRFAQGRGSVAMGFRRERAFPEYLLGALIGTAMISASIGICAMTGSVTVTRSADFSVGLWILYGIGFLVQGASEEVLCRGYFMVSVARRNHLALAVLLNSAAFSMLHLLNPGVSVPALINILLFGIFASVYVLRRGSLWGACAMHSAWNFVQGNGFGVRVSGTAAGPSPLCTVATEGKTFWSGGTFGAEGGFAVTLVLLAGILTLLFTVPNRREECAA